MRFSERGSLWHQCQDMLHQRSMSTEIGLPHLQNSIGPVQLRSRVKEEEIRRLFNSKRHQTGHVINSVNFQLIINMKQFFNSSCIQIKSFYLSMAQRSPKHDSPPRQSFFFMFFVKSITFIGASQQQNLAHPHLKFSVYKGTQILNSTRDPLAFNFEHNWAKPEKLELSFLLKDSPFNHQIDFTVKLHKLENDSEELVGEINIKADKYTMGYLTEKIDRVEEVNNFGNYRVRYLIFTDRNRHNLEKVVRAYRNSQQLQEWTLERQKQVQNEEAKEKKEEIVLEHHIGNDEVYEELIAEQKKANEVLTPQKKQKEQEVEATQKIESKEENKAEEIKEKQNQSEVIEVSEAYPITQDNIQPQKNAIQPENIQNKEETSVKESKEQVDINKFSEIKQKPAEMEESASKPESKETGMKDSGLRKSGLKGSGYYDRKPEYYEPPKAEEPEYEIPIIVSHPPEQKIAKDEEPAHNKLDQVSFSVSEMVKKDENEFRKTDSLNEIDQDQNQKISQVIETVNGQNPTPDSTPDSKSSDWKLTLKILIFLILAGLSLVYFITPKKEEKVVQTPKRASRVNSKPKKIKKVK